MKIFKTFLITVFVFSITITISMFIFPGGLALLLISSIIESLVSEDFAKFLILGYFYTPLLAPLSFSLIALLNAKKSGSKIWYGISIILFVIFFLWATKLSFNLLRTIENSNQDIPNIPSLPRLNS